MPIDNCHYCYNELTETVLPEYLKTLKQQIDAPIPMSRFTEKGIGIRTLLKQFGFQSDFPGCYVFIEKEDPIYVGISQKLVTRINQHVNGKSHFSASLAYRMTMESYDGETEQYTRKQLMNMDKFRTLFEQKKKYLSELDVAFIEIDNPVERYLFEIYCAMELDTSRWNTFETH
ncbi:MAG: GIY-YIG nuclease family protein [Candidatus Marinimicrobia bacterium]|nr:GIY-YIG nuclease family protein [Candidatus Neomarinimicrobiota bacterium]MCF7880182.1 GIY-YIG nuclease family protein [Candidatus Neomarinimicrobiota bacterium]